jgi:hypothetical protein
MLGLGAAMAGLGLLLLGLGWLVLAIGLYYRLTAGVPGAPAMPGLGAADAEAIPDGLMEWIQEESEPWARAELKRRALEAWREQKDWALVEAELKRSIVERGI